MHTFTYVYNAEYHWERCTFCGCTRNAHEHEYDDDEDNICNVCAYERLTPIRNAKFTYTGYIVGGKVWDFKVSISPDTTGLCWDDDEDYDYYWWIITDFEQYMNVNTYDNYIDNYDHAYFFPNKTYWIGLYLEADDGYDISFLEKTNVSIEGLGTAIYVNHNSYGNYAYAYFELPKIDGQNTILSMHMLSFSLAGYELGARVYDMTITPNAGNIATDSYGYYVYENDYYLYEDEDDVFEASSRYEFDFWIDAPEGYSFFGFSADMLTVEGLGEPTSFWISPGGGYIYASYIMPSLLGEHDHVLNTWANDEDGHWHECENCFGTFDYAEHTYDDANDTTCNVCGYIRKFKMSKVEYEISGYEYGGLVAGLVVSSTDADIISGTYSQSYIVCTDDSCLYYDYSSMVIDSAATFMEKQTYYLVVVVRALTYDISGLTKGDVTLEGVGNPISLIYYSNYNYSYAIFKLATLYAPHIHTGAWIQEVPSTCSQAGTKGHKICDICGKYFDENGDEITDLVIAIDQHAHLFELWTKETSATTESEGAKAHKDCLLCHKHFDENGVEIEEIIIPKLDAKLSGGAIAGIVIVCAVVASCGVFAFVWFVIKKKKLADLAKIFRNR